MKNSSRNEITTAALRFVSSHAKMMNPTNTSAIISVPVTLKDAASPPPNSSIDVTMLSDRKG